MILYCHTGSRSYQVQHVMKAQGFKHVGNLTYGIIAYDGEIER
jgi:rhodanese-related sulfurtransferase